MKDDTRLPRKLDKKKFPYGEEYISSKRNEIYNGVY